MRLSCTLRGSREGRIFRLSGCCLNKCPVLPALLVCFENVLTKLITYNNVIRRCMCAIRISVISAVITMDL